MFFHLFCRIDDILGDSDSDLDIMDDEKKAQVNAVKQKRKQHESFIQEAGDDIVDLVDVNSIGRITSKSERNV